MFNQYEVAAVMVDELPGIKEELMKVSPIISPFKCMECLAHYTKQLAANHDMLMVKKCFAFAEKIYYRGNSLVKIAVENVYVFSFSSLMFSCNRKDRNKLQSLMPVGLHTAYVQQVLHSGI